jgi:hypothetical protein
MGKTDEKGVAVSDPVEAAVVVEAPSALYADASDAINAAGPTRRANTDRSLLGTNPSLCRSVTERMTERIVEPLGRFF